MGSNYHFQTKAHNVIKNNRRQFAEKMNTSLILNTNIINDRLHVGTKQQIEANLTQHGAFSANCLLLDHLRKFDSGGLDLYEAFHETEFKGPHRDLALILQNGLRGCDTERRSSTNSSVTSPQARQEDLQLSTAVQETKKSFTGTHQCQEYVKTPSQSPENQLTELTSVQHAAFDADSTSCNVTSPRKFAASPEDVNKAHAMMYKREKNKEMQTFLVKPTPEIQNMTSVSSEPFSESFVISDSQIKEAFSTEGRDTVHEIDSLKLGNIEQGHLQHEDDRLQNGSTMSQTFLKREQNEEQFRLENDSTNSQTFLKREQNEEEYNSFYNGDQHDYHVSEDFIEINPRRKKIGEECIGASLQTIPKGFGYENEGNAPQALQGCMDHFKDDTSSAMSSAPERDSLVNGDSQIKQAFHVLENDSPHEKDNLNFNVKLTPHEEIEEDCIGSQTFLKQVQKEEEFDRYRDKDEHKGFQYSYNYSEGNTRCENDGEEKSDCATLQTIPKQFQYGDEIEVYASDRVEYQFHSNSQNFNDVPSNDIPSAKINREEEKSEKIEIESKNIKARADVGNRSVSCTEGESPIVSESETSNLYFCDSNEPMPPVNRINSCPCMNGCEEGNGNTHENDSNGGIGATVPLGRFLSLPATKNNFIFNNLLGSCRSSVCKGLAGNL